MTSANVIVPSASAVQGNDGQIPATVRLSVLESHLYARELSLNPIFEQIESFLKTDELEVACEGPSVREFSGRSSVDLDRSAMIQLDEKCVNLLNSLDVELFPGKVRLDLSSGVKRGLADALRDRARFYLSMAARVLSGPEFESVPVLTAADIASRGKSLQEVYEKAEEYFDLPCDD